MPQSKESVHTEVINGRKLKIRITPHPERKTPQSEFEVSGNLRGTHIPGGLGGITTETNKEKLLVWLRKDIAKRMTTEPNPNHGTS
jgi:hypothetical protein